METLSNPAVTSDLGALIDATTVINSYVKWISSLPDSVAKVSDVKDLTSHLAAAKTHARYWQTTVKPLLEKSASDIVEISMTFNNRIQDLQKLLSSFGKTPGVKENFVEVLKNLEGDIKAKSTSVAQVVTSVNTFSQEREEDMRNFESDVEEAKLKITGDCSDLKSLYDQLSAINRAIDHDNSLIAGGIFLVWLAVAGGVDLHKQEGKKKDVESQIAQKKLELATLSSFQAQYSRLLMAAEPVAIALSSLEQGWSSLGSGINEVISELGKLTDPEAADYLGPILTTASRDWTIVLAEAQKLSSGINGVAPFA